MREMTKEEVRSIVVDQIIGAVLSAVEQSEGTTVSPKAWEAAATRLTEQYESLMPHSL